MHLVDDEGRQDDSKYLQEIGREVREQQTDGHDSRPQQGHRTHRQRSQSKRYDNHHVGGEQDVVYDEGETRLQVGKQSVNQSVGF